MNCGNPQCSICNTKPQPEPQPPQAPYKAQLRVVCGNDRKPVPNMTYSLILAGDKREAGTTDAHGLTHVVGTSEPLEILRLTATGSATASVCCDARDDWWATQRLYIGGDPRELATTVLADVAPITEVKLPKGTERRLTSGEIAMARTVFGDGINYSKVKIHHNGYRLFFGLQDKNTAVTPNGEMYMPRSIYMDDYSVGGDAYKRLFMHEMVHVWQYQMGYSVKMNGLRVTSRGESAYVYELTERSRLADFNMEQQGDLMADYYMICIRKSPKAAYNPGKNPSLLYQVMLPFVNPRDPKHLPTK